MMHFRVIQLTEYGYTNELQQCIGKNCWKLSDIYKDALQNRTVQIHIFQNNEWLIL